MSVDYLIVTSLEYDIQQFIERIPNSSSIKCTEAHFGGYLIEKDDGVRCWLSLCDYSENEGASFIDDHDPEQIDTILQYFQKPKFFLISAPCSEYLYWFIELVANTDDVLIDYSYEKKPLPGSEFVRRTKAGERL